MKKIILVLSLSILFISCGYSQMSASDSILFYSYLRQSQKKDTKDPLSLLNKARKLAVTPFDKLLVLKEKAYYYLDRNKLDSAAKWNEKCLLLSGSKDEKILDEITRCFQVQRTILIRRGEYRQAIKKHKDALIALSDFDTKNKAGIMLNIGIDYWRIEEYDSAKWQLDKTLIYSSDNNYYQPLMRTYIMFGLLFKSTNKIYLAEEYYKHVFDLIGDQIKENARDYMITCNNLANVFEVQEKFDSALYYYGKALDFIESEDLGYYEYLRPYYHAEILTHIGNMHVQNEDYEIARPIIEKAIKIQSKYSSDSHPDLINIYNLMAHLSVKLEKYDESERYLSNSARISKKNELGLSALYNLYGDLYLEKGDVDLAISYYDSAIQANPSIKIDEVNFFSYPDHFLSSIEGKTKSLYESEENRLELLQASYDEVKNTLEYLYSTADETNLFDDINITLESYYKVFADEYSMSGSPLYLEKMWQILEFSKASKLRAQLRNEYSLNYSLPKDVLNQEILLKENINKLTNDLQSLNSDSLLFHAKREYDDFVKNLEVDFPEYFKLKNSVQFQRVENVRENLAENEISLNYLEGEKLIHCLYISSKKTLVFSVDKNRLGELIASHNDAILSLDEDLLLSSSSQIINELQLTQDILSDFKRLLVIPSGEVWKLNFSGLSISNLDNEDTFLGNEYALSFKYYGSNTKYKSANFRNEMLAFSYNKDAENISLTSTRSANEDLPGTAQEVEELSQIWEGDFHFSETANETKFKTSEKKYKILHLALHGFQDEVYPENSYLKFSQSDSLNDGILYAYELYNMNLDAELAVLSACHSGSGKVFSGEGMMSMARSFTYAGVKSLVASRWNVPDYSTPLIMGYFYQGLKDGMTKSDALSSAQRQYLENDADKVTSSPFYWSGFYIVGEDSSISSPRNSYLIILLFLVLLGIMIWKKKALILIFS